MTSTDRLRVSGTSAAAIRQHYDLSDDFFRLWLGPDLVYSCAWWDPVEAQDTVQRAQLRKLDHFAQQLGVSGRRVLDVGCGWGALLDRFVRVHGAASGVGLTLSPAQQAYAAGRDVPGTTYSVQSWVDHEPDEPYDVITAIESTEHFASDELDPDEKVEVYRSFFERAASWLRPGGRMGLQLICLDNVGHDGSRPGRGPFTDLILDEIFPESMSASLTELVLGWETHFELDTLLEHSAHYRRTFRAWNLALREQEERARSLVGDERLRTFGRYMAAGEAAFRLREQTLHRVTLTKRPEPKSWAVALRPSLFDGSVEQSPGASGAAVQQHYDVSNEFYAQWLGDTMMYSSGLWAQGEGPDHLDTAVGRKVDFFVSQVLPGPASRVLDVGCGWGWNLRRLAARHDLSSGVGLTLSRAQQAHVAEHPIPGVEVRLEDWRAHEAEAPYDAITSFGAFEHFARDGTTAPERVATYRQFFSTCADWLVPGGRLGLETIAHDGAPDTASPLGRGPLGDAVLEIFPESICPHLSEVLLGCEPFFELEVLRSDAADFARTMRAWLVGLRRHEEAAVALVGREQTRRFRRYLASSELQFRTRTVTNYRLVLRRRPMPRF